MIFSTILLYHFISTAWAAPTCEPGATPGKISVNWDGTSWIGAVTVGNQEVNMLLDTGSSDFWLPSTLMPKAQQVAAQESGSLFKANAPGVMGNRIPGATWTAAYSAGSTRGNVVVRQPVTSSGGLSVKGQSVELANTATTPRKLGILGLGFAAGNGVKIKGQKSPQTAMWMQPCYMSLTTNLGPVGNTNTWFGIGYDDPAARGGSELVMQPMMTGTRSFIVPSPKTVINGVEMENALNYAMLDTGRSGTRLAEPVVRAFYHAIPGSSRQGNGIWWLPCDPSQLPDIQLAIGNQMLPLAKEALLGRKTRSGLCVGNIQAAQPGGKGPYHAAIYGSAIFKSAYWMFRVESTTGQTNPTFGFVPY